MFAIQSSDLPPVSWGLPFSANAPSFLSLAQFCFHDLAHIPVPLTSVALVWSKCSQGWDVSSPVISALHPLLSTPSAPQIPHLGSYSALSFSFLVFIPISQGLSSIYVSKPMNQISYSLKMQGRQLSVGIKCPQRECGWGWWGRENSHANAFSPQHTNVLCEYEILSLYHVSIL